MQAVKDKRARILIADDDAQIREVLHELLGDDYECAEVSSAEEALELLRTESFNLVLSDIMMGGITGLQMVPQVLERAPDTVVIMISGEQNIESAIDALRAGAFDYITKPFDLRHVEAAVKRALEHHELRASKRYYENFLEEMVKHRTVELNKANQTLSVLIKSSPLAIFVFDTEGRVRLWNPAAEATFGWSEEEVLDHPFPLVPEERRETFRAGFEGALAGKVVTDYQTRRRRKDGSLIEVNVWMAALRDESGAISGIMAIVADITERMQAAARINYLAYHDTLTTLPNRVSFEERLTDAISRAATDSESLAVMFLSLDRFKKFNDTLGHMVGDQLLKSVSDRLRPAMKEGDTLARFGSDEFSFLLTGINKAEDAARLAREFQSILEAPFNVEGHELYVTSSIGISVYPADGMDSQELLKSAGAALYRAKQSGGSNYQFYTADM
ncbi:MAG TPA: diguanylate cyclase, partial [Pyrinomonadaceae bacterium]|nr:diguanylate cyclase [Pyrinomonadaceae bacterium]